MKSLRRFFVNCVDTKRLLLFRPQRCTCGQELNPKSNTEEEVDDSSRFNSFSLSLQGIVEDALLVLLAFWAFFETVLLRFDDTILCHKKQSKRWEERMAQFKPRNTTKVPKCQELFWLLANYLLCVGMSLSWDFGRPAG